MSSVDILILGAGWTSSYLIPLLHSQQISYASTTRSGRESSIPFVFNPDSDDPAPFRVLPIATTVLITLPIRGLGGSRRLLELYQLTHPTTTHSTHFIQLGSSGIYASNPAWSDRHSDYDKNDARAIAEDELLSLSTLNIHTTVLNLSGLWGGARNPRNWVKIVAPTKQALANKTSLHLIHGEDLARSIIAVHRQFDKAAGARWLLTDQRVYDWWDLASAWGDGAAHAQESGEINSPHAQWVAELMKQHEVRALPRPPEVLGRALDSTEFWSTFGLQPIKARVN